MSGPATSRLRALAATGIVSLVLIASAAPPAHALDNGLARTPPMGFNDWNAFGCNVTQGLIRETADAMVASGMRDAGYRYVNIDDCWMATDRDAEGRLVPDPQKFPDGIKATADYVHTRGLKLGIYEDAGTQTCGGYPGSLGHEQVDAQTFAEWGVEYLKYDNCHNADLTTGPQYLERYRAMRDALAATGRPIILSICEWGLSEPWTWAAPIGNLWRTTGDIVDHWDRLKFIVLQNAEHAAAAGPGAWNDPDMLEVGNGGMTDTEYRSHFSLWATMAAPLLAGTDLRRATPATMAIYLNQDVIAVDQDPLGTQGRVVASDGPRLVFAKPLASGDVAVALFNAGDAPATMSTTAAQVGLGAAPAYALRDLWSKALTESTGDITAVVPPHGTTIYRASLLDHASAPPPGPRALPRLRVPANLRLRRASAQAGFLDAQIGIAGSAVAPGATLTLTYESGGHTARFSVPIAKARVTVHRRLPPSLRQQSTGIVRIAYAGSASVRRDAVRLRVAPGASRLRCATATIKDGRLVASGTIAPDARGSVQVRLAYAADDATRLPSWNAKITAGRWRVEGPLPAGVRAGELSIRYPGSLLRRLRGEQLAVHVSG